MYLSRTVLSGGPRLRVPIDRSVGHTTDQTGGVTHLAANRGTISPTGFTYRESVAGSFPQPDCAAFETFSAGDPVRSDDEV
jgi:hypothetical protein